MQTHTETHTEQPSALVGSVAVCHVITATADVLNKLSLVGKNLTAYSLETVEMFREDALVADYTIPVSAPPREGVSLEVP